MTDLLAGANCAVSAAESAARLTRSREIEVEVRGTPWIISTGSGTGAGVYQCGNTAGAAEERPSPTRQVDIELPPRPDDEE